MNGTIYAPSDNTRLSYLVYLVHNYRHFQTVFNALVQLCPVVTFPVEFYPKYQLSFRNPFTFAFTKWLGLYTWLISSSTVCIYNFYIRAYVVAAL